MNFDYTFITLFGFIFFEPMVVLTNLVFFIFSIFFFFKINRRQNAYALQMARFILFLGISTFFGAIGHTIQYQLGKPFFNLILLLMNAFSLFSVYFLFRASYWYLQPNKGNSNYFVNAVLLWLSIILCISWFNAEFTLIKVHAGLVLVFTLYVHVKVYRHQKDKGNEWLIAGVLVSFIPIIIHSLHISIHKWFNHKDLAHVFMILSLLIIYKGIQENLATLKLKSLN